MKPINKIIASIILFTGFLGAPQVIAQNITTICLGDDLTICAGDGVTIDICPPTPGSITQDTNVVFIGNVGEVNLTDDVFSGVVPIGFSFEYYGVPKTQCVIGSNNFISFDITQANGYCQWPINQASPSAGNPNDAIMGPWQDINPSTGGFIGYTTIGTAPNRKFVVVYKDVPVFGSPNEPTCSAIVLHETTNEIDVFIDEKPALPGGWNGGYAIEGTQNATGLIADIFPGRNFPSVWSAVNDGVKWTPNGPNDYTVAAIPYKAYVPSNVPFVWGDTEGNTITANPGGGSITVFPSPTAPSDSIGYFINYSSCNQTGSAVTSEISWITVNVPSVTMTTTDDICSQGVGTATANPIGIAPFTYLWSDPNAQTTQTAVNLFGGAYQVTMIDALGCDATTFGVVGDNPITTSTTYTQVSCPSGSDGTATVSISPVPGSATYNWFNAGGQTTQTAVGLSAGTYNVEIITDVGCIDTAEVVVDEIPGMVLTTVSVTDVTCNSGNDGMVEVSVSNGTTPYTYVWTNSVSTTNIANDLFVGSTTVTVTDANGCMVNETYTLAEPQALAIVTYDGLDVVCPGDSAVLSATASGGSSAYTFTWTENGNIIGVGNSLTVTPTNTTTNYCVSLSEACGSPTTDSCKTITWPTEIIPSINPDITASCIPVEVIFGNTTASTEIDYTVWNYGDGTDIDTTFGMNNAIHAFQDAGLFDVSMEVTSIFGCKYDMIFSDLIEGWSFPTADFYLNPNPASIFEPTVSAFSQSSNDAVSYLWQVPNATPSFSSSKNAEFTFPDTVAEYPVTLIVTNSNGCSDTLQRIASLQNEVQIFAPNSFTPDNDEFNQTWKIYMLGIDVYDFNLIVYNRWGEVIWESNNSESGWDGTYGGKLVPAGSYVWKIETKDKNTDKRYTFDGYVNVIR